MNDIGFANGKCYECPRRETKHCPAYASNRLCTQANDIVNEDWVYKVLSVEQWDTMDELSSEDRIGYGLTDSIAENGIDIDDMISGCGLTFMQYNCIVYFYKHGLSQGQIAHEFEITQPAVSTHIKRALNKLRRALLGN